MKNLWIKKSFVNKTKGWLVYESDVYESAYVDKGSLFRDLQKEYGRCESKIFIDYEKEVKQIGWVFVKKVRYSDCNEGYLQEVWIEVHVSEPVKMISFNYA